MEDKQEKQFETVIKKSVAMYTMLTGKPMSEREGRAFIEIFDMADAYVASGAQSGSAAETFDILSQVTGPDDDDLKRRLASELAKNPPKFVGRTINDTLDDTLAYGAGHMKVQADDKGALHVEHIPRSEVYTDPASPDGDHSVTATVSTDENGAKTVIAIEEHEKCGCLLGRCTCTDQMLDATKKRYTPPPITSKNRDHIQGYDWNICVLSRVKNTEDSYVIHYAEMPTQAQLDEHFVKYHERTHYVHVNEWVNWGWEGITGRYDRTAPASTLTQPNKIVRTTAAPEKRGRDVSAPPVSSPWEQEDKAWRIRYYSDVAAAVVFHYVDKRPTAAEMAHFHHSKCMAVSQAKPKQAA